MKSFANHLTEYTTTLTSAESILPDSHPRRDQCRDAKLKLRQDAVKPANRSSESFRKKAVQSLKDLKTGYIAANLDLFHHARLDTPQDRKKAERLADFRTDQLKMLTAVPSINRSQLTEIQDEFGNLKTGTALTAADLESSPTCGEFFPAMEKAAGVPAEQRLKNLATKIEQTYDSWVSPLLNDLDDPVTQENLDLLQAAERKLIDTFRSEKALPDPLPNKLVTAFAQTMKGLARVPISATKLCDALFPVGAPATVDEVKERFTGHLDQLVKGLDRSKVRMVLETEETPG